MAQGEIGPLPPETQGTGMNKRIAKIVKDDGEDIEGIGLKSEFVELVEKEMLEMGGFSQLLPLMSSRKIDSQFIRHNKEYRHLLCVARYYLLTAEFGISHEQIEATIKDLAERSLKGICTVIKSHLIVGDTDKALEWKGSDERKFNGEDVYEFARACAHHVHQFDRLLIDINFFEHLGIPAKQKAGRKIKSVNAHLIELAKTRNLDKLSMDRIKQAKGMFFGDSEVSPEIATFLQLYFWRMEKYLIYTLSKKMEADEIDPMKESSEEAVLKVQEYLMELLPTPPDWEEVYSRDLMKKSNVIHELLEELNDEEKKDNGQETD